MPIYRVNHDQVARGQVVMNVLHYETTGELSLAQMEEAADDMRAAYVSENFELRHVNEWAWNTVTFRRVDIPGLPELTVNFSAGPLVGTSTADDTPLQVALLVTGQAMTEFPRRVRTYFGGFSEGQLTEGLWSDAIVLEALQVISNLDDIDIVDDVLERVAVRYNDLGDGPFVEAWNRVTTYDVTEVPATQRRRRIGVGA